MTDNTDRSGTLVSSVGELLLDYFGQDAGQVQVEGCESASAHLSLEKYWRLSASLHHKTLTGAHRGNNYGSHAACREAAGNTRRAIEAGEMPTYVQSLEQFVAGGIERATWESEFRIGDHSETYLYTHSCSSCGGQGQTRCSPCSGSGKTGCHYCSRSGQRHCGTCGGSGIEGHDQFRKPCFSCGGSGRQRCNHCFGSGQTSCGSCSGSGSQYCSPCDATGYFTEHYRISVGARGQLAAQYPESLDDWQRRYIEAAVNDAVRWAPLSASCRLDERSVLRSEPAYPLQYTIDGDLLFTEADLTLRQKKGHGLFVGETCRTYQLDELGDALFEPMADQLADGEDSARLGAALNNRAAQNSLACRAEPASVEQTVLRRAGIVSSAAVGNFLQKYHALAAALRKKRSQQSLKDWALKALKYTALILLSIATIDMCFGNRIGWEDSGLIMLAAEPRSFLHWLWYYSEYIWFSGLIETRGVFAGGILGCYLLARWQLLSRRRSSKFRFLAGLALTNILLVGLFMMFSPVLFHMGATGFGVPGVANAVTGLVHSLILLPEAVILGLLIAMARLRQRKDLALKKYVSAVDSSPLLADLGYR